MLFSLGCTRNSGLPEVGSKEYRDFCSAFYVGLAGLESGEDVRAKSELTRATQLVPAEPVAWADLGVFKYVSSNSTQLSRALKGARLSADSSRIEEILGLIESRRGRVSESLAHLRKAVSLDGKNLKALYALADETSRQGLPGGDAEAAQTLERLLSVAPSNTAVLLEVVRLSAKSGDVARLRQTLEKLAPFTGNWPDAAKQQLAAIQQTAAGGSPQSAAVQVQFLKNVLVRVAGVPAEPRRCANTRELRRAAHQQISSSSRPQFRTGSA